MSKKFVFIAVLTLIMFVLYFFISGTNKKLSCKAQGGRWIVTGPLGENNRPTIQYCFFPPEDEGQECYQNSDCAVDCVSTGQTDAEGYYIGNCSEYSIFDCSPTIPNKTNDKRMLKGGPCS